MDFLTNLLSNSDNNMSYPPPMSMVSDIGSAFSPLPMVADPAPHGPPPGLESTTAADIPVPPVSPKATSLWGIIKQDSTSAFSGIESVVSTIYKGGKAVAGTVVTDVGHGISTVVGEVAAPVESAVNNVYWKLILAVVVIGGVVYFAGKSGALRISR